MPLDDDITDEQELTLKRANKLPAVVVLFPEMIPTCGVMYSYGETHTFAFQLTEHAWPVVVRKVGFS